MSLALNRHFHFTLATAAILLAATGGSAENTIIEQFDYADATNISALNGGTGWSGAWTNASFANTLMTSAGGLSYPDLPNAPAGGKLLVDNSQVAASSISYRVFNQGFTSGSVYVSFIMDSVSFQNPLDTAQTIFGGRFGGIALFSANGTTSANEKVLLGQGSQLDGTPGNATWLGMNRVRTSGGGTVGTLPAPAAVNFLAATQAETETLIVAKIEFDAGGTPAEPQAGFTTDAEKITLWLNPDLGVAEESNAPFGGSYYVTERDMGEFKRIRIGGGGFNGSENGTKHLIDEIRISDVSPFFTVPGTLPGDFNDDGTVDSADYVAFEKGLIPAGHAGEDYDDFVAGFGNSLSGAGGSGAVPEPAGFVLLAIGSCFAASFRRRAA